MSFKVPEFDEFDKNETDKDLSDPLGDISLDDDFYGISNTAKTNIRATKLSKEDHSKKIANIFGLEDSPSGTFIGPAAKPKDKPGPTSASASDWLGLKDSPSPQKKSAQEGEENIFNSQTHQTSNPGGLNKTRRNSEVPLNQSKKVDKTLPEYKSLDLGLSDSQGGLGGEFPRGVHIKESLMDPSAVGARGSRRSSLKVDNILNFDLATATEDLKKRKQDGDKSEYNSLDMERSHMGSGATTHSSEQKSREARSQQTKDDLNSFFSMSTTQSRRPGLSRRRETSPNPTVLDEPTDQTYDWLGSTSGQNTSTRKKDFDGLPSWLMRPEDNLSADTNIKTNSDDANRSQPLQDPKSKDTSTVIQTKQYDTPISPVKAVTNQRGLQVDDTTNEPDIRTTNNSADHKESSSIIVNHVGDSSNTATENVFSEKQDDPLIKSLEQSVGSILDIRSYNKIVQDQNRMINVLIKQQSGYMCQLIHRIAAVQGNDLEAMEQQDSADNANQNKIKISALLAQIETLELELKLARMGYEQGVQLLETKWKDTVSMMEEKCSHRIAMREEECSLKEERWIELERHSKQRAEDVAKEKDEIVTWYKKRLDEIQQEYSGEISTLREHIDLIKTQYTEEKKSKQFRLPSTETEWNEREVELVEKEKRLQEQNETLTHKTLQLEERRKELENEKEEFEMRKFRDQNAMNAESKRLKRAHNLLVFEQEHWEEEVTKEKEQMKRMRQTIEKMRETLQSNQEQLSLQQLKLATEKSKMDVLLKMNSGVDLIQSKAEADSVMQVAKATIASVKETKEKLQDEKARLMDLEQEVTLRERMAEKLMRMSEQKQAEGLNALEDSKRLEASFKHKSEAIQQQLAELSIREHKLTKEKFEIQREKELIEKRKEKLFAFLPDLENTYQQPTIIDPRSIITKLRAEKDIEND